MKNYYLSLLHHCVPHRYLNEIGYSRYQLRLVETIMLLFLLLDKSEGLTLIV
jgi:hypothetical protein